MSRASIDVWIAFALYFPVMLARVERADIDFFIASSTGGFVVPREAKSEDVVLVR
jgi:hypothetical protein